MCGFCETAVQYVKIALHNNQTVAQIEHAVDQLCDSAFAGLDAGPAQVCACVCLCVCVCVCVCMCVCVFVCVVCMFVWVRAQKEQACCYLSSNAI